MARLPKLVVALLAIAAAAAALWLLRGREGSPAGRTSESGPQRGGTLIASLRSEPARYNRYVDDTAPSDVLSLLLHSRLIRINRITDELEPALAERWTEAADGLSYTLTLRDGVQFSDGTPFTSADVLFTARALYDPKVESVLAQPLRVGGQNLVFEAPDARTVVIRFPQRYAPGLRMLESFPILPKHKLEQPLNDGRYADHWKVGMPLSELVGLGPFVLREHVAGQRMEFARNPHYWKRDAAGTQLPYLDGLTVVFTRDQNTEAVRMQAGDIDLMVNADIRPDDVASFRRAADAGRLRLLDVGIGLDPNVLWFNLADRSPRRALFHERAFRQALSYAIDRAAIVNTVYLGAAVPVSGPVTPGNRTWYSDAAPKYSHDQARARELLSSLGLADRDGDGMLEQKNGQPVRFSILTQRGHTIRERTVAAIQEHLRHLGIAVDVVALDPPSIVERWMGRDYDAIYFSLQANSTDPALNGDFWMSSGPRHLWNPGQPAPATDAERQMDELLRRQATAPTLSERQQAFAGVQKIMGEELFGIYLVAPRVTIAVSRRVANPQPALLIPQLFWSVETLAVAR